LADLSLADLSSADLSSANLRSANLRLADLSLADLSSADLSSADLTRFRDDFWAVLSGEPSGVAFLRAAMVEGRIDGTTYKGECSCLAGTLGASKGVAYNGMQFVRPDSGRPAEVWFYQIRKGDKPGDNSFSKTALEWLDQWVGNVSAAFAPQPETPANADSIAG